MAHRMSRSHRLILRLIMAVAADLCHERSARFRQMIWAAEHGCNLSVNG
jgi:hypothetical protein